MADAQPEPGTPEQAVGRGAALVERHEQALLFTQRDADTRVAHRKADARSMVVFLFEHHPHDDLTLIGEFDGVSDQVVENLDDACFITDKMVGDVAIDHRDQFEMPRMGLWGPQCDRRLDAFAQLEGFVVEYQLSRLEL